MARRSYEELTEDVKNVVQELLRTRNDLRAEFKNYINSNLIDSVKEQMMESSWIQGMIETAVKNTPLIKELQAVRTLLREEKKTKNSLRIENDNLKSNQNTEKYGVNPKIKELTNQVNELTEIVEQLKNQINKNTEIQSRNNMFVEKTISEILLQNKTLYLCLKEQGLTEDIYLDTRQRVTDEYTNQKPNTAIVGKKKDETTVTPIRVKRSLIENQGEYIFDNPEKIKKPEFREGVETHGISKRTLAKKLGVAINTPENAKGRIQDYIKEKHPGKDIYVRVKLKGYGDKGQDVVKFFPQLIAWTLLDISESRTEPWTAKVRQAILNGTVILED